MLQWTLDLYVHIMSTIPSVNFNTIDTSFVDGCYIITLMLLFGHFYLSGVWRGLKLTMDTVMLIISNLVDWRYVFIEDDHDKI